MVKSRKGSQFERDLCKKLSSWWTSGARQDVFWRTAGSGGMATNRRRKGEQTQVHCGDLCATDEVGAPFLKVFAAELKRGYSKDTLQDVLDAPTRVGRKSTKQTYEKWFEQASRSRDDSGAIHWMIIAKRDQRTTLVLFPFGLYSELSAREVLQPSSVLLYLTDNGNSCAMMKLDDFLEAVTPSLIQEMARRPR